MYQRIRLLCGTPHILGRDSIYHMLRTQHQQQQMELRNTPIAHISSSCCHLSRKVVALASEDIDEDLKRTLPPVLQFLEDKRIIYNSYIYNRYLPMSNFNKLCLMRINIRVLKSRRQEKSIPIIVQDKAVLNISGVDVPSLRTQIPDQGENIDSFPFTHHTSVSIKKEEISSINDPIVDYENLPDIDIKQDMMDRMEEYEDGIIKPVSLYAPSEITTNDEDDAQLSRDNYNNDGGHLYENEMKSKPQHGTADKTIPASDVPCGGCGALLHCQDPSVPGFKPREVFVGHSKEALRATVCQRCYFLSNYNIALQVQVAPESYLDLLRPIKSKVALVLLLVDLTDAPCSIHPGIMEVIAPGQPVVVVGTKVDLLPMDSHNCLHRLRAALESVVGDSALAAANIVHTCLVSGHTGFGVEEIVSVVHGMWRGRGDIYLVGSTNAGKSTLYNAFINSDMCKKSATQVLLKATTSTWPGTTLNMLKFPVQRPSGRRLFERAERLRGRDLQRVQQLENVEAYTSNPQLATLTADIEQTISTTPATDHDTKDLFVQTIRPPKFDMQQVGINDKNAYYRESKWCYDTPGALQPDQFLSLLTNDELVETLPKTVIVPETYSVCPGRSLFIAGLGRIDVLNTHHTEEKAIGKVIMDTALLTVFRSSNLPISVVRTIDASAFYRDHLGTDLLHVPRGTRERLDQWPALQPTNATVKGVEMGAATADLVLSSAGWVSIALSSGTVCQLRLWTPGGRGAYVRRQPFLPLAVKMRGERFRKTIKYRPHRLYDGRFFRESFRNSSKGMPDQGFALIKSGIKAVKVATGETKMIAQRPPPVGHRTRRSPQHRIYKFAN